MKLPALFLSLLCLPLLLSARQPNVVVILTDDQGWGDLSLNGNSNLSTPNIDQLAAEGASFDRFYVCPVCSPTRAEFLTGRYHQRGGVYSTSAGGERLDQDELTIGDVFRSAGYATGAYGKWHNGMQFPYHPNGRGFDDFYGFCSGHWGDYFSPMLEHNGEIVTGDGFVVDDFTNRAMNFIEENKEKPFFVYLPYNTPHSPMQVPDRFWNKFKDKDLAMHHRDPEKEEDLHLRCALAMCENIDWNVGRVLEKLNALDLTEDTIVIYFCDNGPNGWRWNGGMKGRKGSTDEGGVRSPMIIRWPGKIAPATRIETLGSAIDLMPTLASMAGVSFEPRKPLDGKDLSSVLLGETPANELQNRKVFSAWKNKASVRTAKYRIGNEGGLYDMEKDPGQGKDVRKQKPELHAELTKELRQWKAEMVKELGTDTRPFVIAHPGHAFTQIPARDGVPHGGIERSNKFPNDSFFGNWTSKEDRIVWTAEVAESGEFEVLIYYTCDPEDVGATVELSFNGAALSGTISEPNPSPLIGAEEDRAPRVESYTQDWKPMKLGTISLEKGEGELTLRATDIPGKEVMDFRLLLLKRLK
ncbi:MAG: N-acetylgalactosamine 6-sulfate sulfatase [Verrucomicrobiales bacterium]|nr:N-acetylgalactosamine 6-sulfate sulfatase [Verrucomicrobiales bacterium]